MISVILLYHLLTDSLLCNHLITLCCMLPCSENVRFRNFLLQFTYGMFLSAKMHRKLKILLFKFVLLSLSLNLTEKIRLEN